MKIFASLLLTCCSVFAVPEILTIDRDTRNQINSYINFTNALNTYAGVFTGSASNYVPISGGTFTGSVYSTVDHTENLPSATELVTAEWVRSLALQGAEWFFTMNITSGYGEKTTNFVELSAAPPLALFTNSIASPITSDSYLVGGIATQMYGALRSPISYTIYMNTVGGNPSTVIPAHPEIYYVYNGTTNHLGDWEVANQVIAATTPTKYTYTIPFVEPSITGSVYLIGYLKSGTVSGTDAGLNIYGGGIYPSHLDVEGVNAGETAQAVQANLDAHTNETGTAVHGLGDISTRSSNDFYLASNPSNYVDATVTNGLASTNWVDLYYYPRANPSNYVADAPSDTNQYARQSNTWVVVEASGGEPQTPWTEDIDGAEFALTNAYLKDYFLLGTNPPTTDPVQVVGSVLWTNLASGGSTGGGPITNYFIANNNSVAQNTSDGVMTLLNATNELADTGGFYNPTTKVFTATSTSKWLFNLVVQSDTKGVKSDLYVNGNSVLTWNTSVPSFVNFSHIVLCTNGTTVAPYGSAGGGAGNWPINEIHFYGLQIE